MATNTTNYGFKKPDESDFYDVADQNKNWDLADEALKNLDTPTFEDYTGSTAVPSATDAIDQIKSKGKLGTLLSNIKAAFKGACLIGHIVNNCVTDNTGLPLSAAQGKVLKDLIDTTNNNLSKRFAINNTENTYNALSDLPETGSGFGTTTTGLTLYDGFKIPAYSRICFMNYGGSKDGAIFAIDGDGKTYTAFRNNGTWHKGNSLVSKDDLPNIFTAKLGTSNQESNHATTIKGLWNSFPENQVFACNLVDSNNFCVFGFIYGDHKYGAVLYLAFTDCGIVKCSNGTFSDTKL